jgi:hypothetical protein
MNTKVLFLFATDVIGNATVRRIGDGEFIELSPYCDSQYRFGAKGPLPLVAEYNDISDMMAVDFVLRSTGNLDADFDRS